MSQFNLDRFRFEKRSQVGEQENLPSPLPAARPPAASDTAASNGGGGEEDNEVTDDSSRPDTPASDVTEKTGESGVFPRMPAHGNPGFGKVKAPSLFPSFLQNFPFSEEYKNNIQLCCNVSLPKSQQRVNQDTCCQARTIREPEATHLPNKLPEKSRLTQSLSSHQKASCLPFPCL